jgi:hypothetical protein
MQDPFGTECFDLPIENIEKGVDKDLNNLSAIIANVELADLGAGSFLEAGPAPISGTEGISPVSSQKALLPSTQRGL